MKGKELNKETLDNISKTFVKEHNVEGIDTDALAKVVKSFVRRIEKIEVKSPQTQKSRP